jgi:hypothetical protein
MILVAACDESTAQAVTAALNRRGLRVVRSFDLRSVLAARSHHPAVPCDCGCAFRDTAGCDCQYVVLLVYGNDGAPVTVTVHSRAGLARVEIVSPVSGTFRNTLPAPDPRLAGQVRDVLVELTLVLQTGPADCRTMTTKID